MSDTIDVKVTHQFKASAERVYDAWLDAEKARQWMSASLKAMGVPGVTGEMGTVEIDPVVGGKFLFTDMRDGVEAKHTGEYLELDRPRRIAFTWVVEWGDIVDASKATLDIEPDGDGCIATITHEMDAKWAEYVEQTENGWGCMLAAVGDYLAT